MRQTDEIYSPITWFNNSTSIIECEKAAVTCERDEIFHTSSLTSAALNGAAVSEDMHTDCGSAASLQLGFVLMMALMLKHGGDDQRKMVTGCSDTSFFIRMMKTDETSGWNMFSIVPSSFDTLS